MVGAIGFEIGRTAGFTGLVRIIPNVAERLVAPNIELGARPCVMEGRSREGVSIFDVAVDKYELLLKEPLLGLLPV